MDLVRKWLGYEPLLNPTNPKYDNQNIKPQQTSQLKNMMEAMQEGVAALKVDGHGYIITYTKGRGTEACTRNARKRSKYVESYIVDPDILDPEVESFAIAGELAAYVDETGKFESPADILEMGYSQVFAVTDYCQKNKDVPFGCMKVFAFRLFDINGLRGSIMRMSDQLLILEKLLEGQRHFHVVRWYKFAVSPQNRVFMEITRGGEMQDVCCRDDFTDYLIRRAGTREGFVVSDDRVDKPAQFKPDHKRQLRDPYCAKARKDFVADVVGVLGWPDFNLQCVDEYGNRMTVASIKCQDVPAHIRNAFGEMTPPEEARVTIRAPNLVVNSKGEYRFMGLHTYMPFTAKDMCVSGIQEIMEQCPHFQASLEQSNKFWRLARDYVSASAPPRAAETPAEGTLAASPGPRLQPPKPPADPLKGEAVYIWPDKFTDQEIKKMYDRCKKLGASCWSQRNRVTITAVLVNANSGYWNNDGDFAKWYTSMQAQPRVYKVNEVDPYSHSGANARCNYLLEACRYAPDWQRLRKHTVVSQSTPLPATILPPQAEPDPEPAVKKQRTKLWPGEYVHIWHSGISAQEYSKYHYLLKDHAHALCDLSYENRNPRLCDILIVKDASVLDNPGTADEILKLFEHFAYLPLVLPTRYVDDRLRAFPDFVSTKDYAIIPDNFPDDYKTYWKNFHAKT